MGWSNEVHANRIELANRKKQSLQHNISTPQPRKPNAGILPIALIVGAVSSSIWWRKGVHKNFAGIDPLGDIAAFVKGLFRGPGKRLTQNKSGSWKAARPGNMAGAAAAQRAQSTTQQASGSKSATQQQAGGAKKKNKKKKRKH